MQTRTTPQRRLILVDFNWTRDKDPRIPLGHASLLAALHADGQTEVCPVVVPVGRDGIALPAVDTMPAVVDTILSYTHGLDPSTVDVAIGAYVWAEACIQRVIPALRDRGFVGRIILGGPQISYAGKGIADHYPGADVFVRGYGEQALVALAKTPGRPVILGVHYAGDEDPAEQAAVDLATLPSPWLSSTIPLHGQRFVRWETQRGCVFSCAFCQHREAGARLTKQLLDEQRIFHEIKLFCAAGVDDIAVLDPIFNAGPLATAVLQHFSDLGYQGKLSLQCRAEFVTTEFLDAAQKLNVQLEFGLQTIHKREWQAVQRKNNIVKVDATLADVRKRGLRHEVSLIFGLPEQTLASFQQTVAWCLERQVPVIKAFPLLLLRGTELDRDRAHWHLQEDGGDMPTVVSSDSFSREDWLAMQRISQVLHNTEGRHPADIAEVLRLADVAVPEPGRWRPPGTK